MSEREEWVSGQQRLWFEAPGLLRLEMHGDWDLPAVEDYMRVLFAITDRTGPVVLLADLSDLQSVPHDARKRLTRFERPYPFRACVLYGASFTMGTLMTMAFKAGRALAPSRFTFPFQVCRTEAEARAWIAGLHLGPPR